MNLLKDFIANTLFQLMAILFWIPGVAPAILYHVSDVDKDIIQDAVVVLHVFSFFPLPGW